ncbi:hypothetical protein HK097_011699, partial [Rhizophlyctis rosea]
MSSSPSSAASPVFLPPSRSVSPNPQPRLHMSSGGSSHNNLEVPLPAKQPESSGKYKVNPQTSPKNANPITPSTKSRSPSPSPRITVQVATPIDKGTPSRTSAASKRKLEPVEGLSSYIRSIEGPRVKREQDVQIAPSLKIKEALEVGARTGSLSVKT